MSKKIKRFISGFLAALMFSMVLPRVAPKVYAGSDEYLTLQQTTGDTIDANLQTTGITSNITVTHDRGKGIAWANADDRYYAIKILKELLEEE